METPTCCTVTNVDSGGFRFNLRACTCRNALRHSGGFEDAPGIPDCFAGTLRLCFSRTPKCKAVVFVATCASADFLHQVITGSFQEALGQELLSYPTWKLHGDMDARERTGTHCNAPCAPVSCSAHRDRLHAFEVSHQTMFIGSLPEWLTWFASLSPFASHHNSQGCA